MGKRKSTSKRRIGAKRLPTGDSDYTRSSAYASTIELFERNCIKNYEDLCDLIEAGFGEQLEAEAIKGFEQAMKRRRGKRWPMFTKATKDLPQAVCVLLMFIVDYQKVTGQTGLDIDFPDRQMQVNYGEAVQELLDDFEVYKDLAMTDMPDLFTRCMGLVKKRFLLPEPKETEPVAAIEEKQRSDGKIKAVESTSHDAQRSKKRGMPLAEAKIEVRRLLKGMTEDQKKKLRSRTFAKQVGCSLGTLSKVPAWQVVVNERKKTRKPKTTRLSPRMQNVVGTGSKDMVLKKIIADQEKDQAEDERQAQLFLGPDNKPHIHE